MDSVRHLYRKDINSTAAASRALNMGMFIRVLHDSMVENKFQFQVNGLREFL